MRFRDQWPKMTLLIAMVVVYIIAAIILFRLVEKGVLKHAPAEAEIVPSISDTDVMPTPMRPSESLNAAQQYVSSSLRRPDGHVNLYKPLYAAQHIADYNFTNSEAVSYYLQIMAQEGNKSAFDHELDYMERNMIHPVGGYLMWKLDDKDSPDGEGGRNIAPDADLRALHALYIAKDAWGDARYDQAIDGLAGGLERVALTPDGIIVAYAGLSGNKTWQAQESYLSYSDFQAIDRLANTRGGVWLNVSQEMRNITLGAQIWNGLYNTNYFLDRQNPYGSSLDNGVYSINSMWIMVRFAESADPVLMNSSMKALDFYREKYNKDGRIVAAYKSNGDPAADYESPWAYALIARAAYALGDKSFGQIMVRKMLDYQDLDNTSENYGAIVEGAQGDERIGQFTMQESILTLQEAEGKAPKFNT